MPDETAIRLALVEQRMDKLMNDMEARDKKLDALLELKNKGMGALWFASLIFGSSLLAGFTSLFAWMRTWHG